jgi:deferrochelatase/peroxidase EfeB
MRLTRRQFAAALAAAAADPFRVYRLVDEAAAKPVRRTTREAMPAEQHLLADLRVVREDGIEVVVPPLHHRVVTAHIAVQEQAAALRDARESLEHALLEIEGEHQVSAAGLAITVAWGLPYFRRFVPSQARRAIPIDARASAQGKREIRILEDAERFPSDPAITRLEENDVAVLLRSDHLATIDEAQRRIFHGLRGLFDVTSIRSGFVGGGADGMTSLPKRMAMQARIPGAELMPPHAELFLGFTSTVRHALGPERIANVETLGYATLRDRYFVGGTHMHLSHLHENLNAWYLNFDHREQVDAMFRPGLSVKSGARTIDQPPSGAETAAEVRADYRRHRRIGHAGSIQTASRLQRTVTGPDGTVYPKGTAVPQRADFNTLDNPFAWSAHRALDRMAHTPAAGTHFVVFNPTSDDFRRVRLAMDGILPDGGDVRFPPRALGQGINPVFHATHRQNFMVPPRAHRSFPLSERRR